MHCYRNSKATEQLIITNEIDETPTLEIRGGAVLCTISTKNGELAMYTMSLAVLMKSISAATELVNNNLKRALDTMIAG